MKGWRKEFESQLKDNFPGVSVSWNGNAPTLVIPDNLGGVKNDIVFFAELLGRECGVVLQFGSSLTKRAADGATTCGECGQTGITGNVCPNCGARKSPRR